MTSAFRRAASWSTASTPASPATESAPRAFGWPTAPPASALARHDMPVSLGDADLAYIDEWVDRGWLGTDRATVVRALIFRLHESLRAS